MPKPEYIENLIGDIETAMLSGGANYEEFLRTVGCHYKRSINDILSIQYHRPNAVAVEDYSFWNTEMNRHVIRNTKGIPLLNGGKLTYVFDIADTKPGDNYIGDPYIWQLAEKHIPAAQSAVADRFGSGGSTLTEQIETICGEAGGYAAAFAIFIRLGYTDTERYLPVSPPEDRAELEEIRGIVSRVLRTIERSVIAIDKPLMGRFTHTEVHRNDRDDGLPQCSGRYDSGGGGTVRESGTRLPTELGTPSVHREVRTDEGGLSGGDGLGAVGTDVRGRQAMELSDRGERDSGRESVQSPTGAGEVGGRDGDIKSGEYVGLDGGDGELQDSGGGDSNERIPENIVLSNETVTSDKGEPSRLSFAVPGVTADELDAILRDGGNDDGSVLRIAMRFAKAPKDVADWLRREYLHGRYGREPSESGK